MRKVGRIQLPDGTPAVDAREYLALLRRYRRAVQMIRALSKIVNYLYTD